MLSFVMCRTILQMTVFYGYEPYLDYELCMIWIRFDIMFVHMNLIFYFITVINVE